jgi:hypothetical protein
MGSSAPMTNAKVTEIPKITFCAVASSVGSSSPRLRIRAAFRPRVAEITEDSLGHEDQNGKAADHLRTKPA